MRHVKNSNLIRLLCAGAVSCAMALCAQQQAQQAQQQAPQQQAQQQGGGRGEDLGYTNTPFLPGQRWRVHDLNRPHPPVVTPGATPRRRHPTPPCFSMARTFPNGCKSPGAAAEEAPAVAEEAPAVAEEALRQSQAAPLAGPLRALPAARAAALKGPLEASLGALPKALAALVAAVGAPVEVCPAARAAFGAAATAGAAALRFAATAAAGGFAPPRIFPMVAGGANPGAVTGGGLGMLDTSGFTEPKWKVENGYFEVVPRTGDLITKEKFGDIQLHIEWSEPPDIEGSEPGARQ